MAEQRDKPAPSRAAGPPAADRAELIRRRIAAVVILIAVAIAIMALTDAAPFFDDVTEEQRVTDTVERFFAAFEQRDFATVCSLFSTDVRQQIETVGATETKKGEPKGCAEILEARYAEVPEEQTKFSLKIEDVRVSGPRAVADVIVKTQQAPKGRSLPIELEQGPDGWLVTRQVITG
jgi:ketosteroid isomerase-like protein